MAKVFHLTIASIGENLFDGEVLSLTAPGEDGILTVLANHEAFVTPLNIGTLKLEVESGERHEFPITTPALLEVSKNQATVIL